MPIKKAKIADETAADSAAKRKAKAKKVLAEKVDDTPKRTVEKTLTAEDFELNPGLTEEGYAIGDTVEVEDENDEEAADEAIASNKVETVDADDLDDEAVEVDIVKGIEYIRTYSLADHGEDFVALAKQFCNKNPDCSMADPTGITSAVVFYREMDKKTKVSYNTSRLFQGADFKKEALKFRNSVNGDYIAIGKK